MIDHADRAQGALMGAFIGDALGLGCHWYYDIDELRREFGPWISDYTTPRPGRYHAGMRAGQISQAGIINRMLLESVVARGGYEADDFTRRLDEDLFPALDGAPMHGPGGYTSQSIREAYAKRVRQRKPWSETGGQADTTEAAERAIVLAALYASSPKRMAEAVWSNTVLTQADEAVVAMTVAYCAVLAQLVRGARLDDTISGRLMALVKSGDLPFGSVSLQTLGAEARQFASPDALLTPGYVARAAADPDIRIDPAWKISIVYAMPCAIYHVLPAAYYLAARFHNDFEAAVLHAINGGGQNQSRAILTGALVGAQVGLSGIPQRFLNGLENASELLALCRGLTALTP
jgi:ADP-ribosylglycohydrolase